MLTASVLLWWHAGRGRRTTRESSWGLPGLMTPSASSGAGQPSLERELCSQHLFDRVKQDLNKRLSRGGGRPDRRVEDATWGNQTHRLGKHLMARRTPPPGRVGGESVNVHEFRQERLHQRCLGQTRVLGLPAGEPFRKQPLQRLVRHVLPPVDNDDLPAG